MAVGIPLSPQARRRYGLRPDRSGHLPLEGPDAAWALALRLGGRVGGGELEAFALLHRLYHHVLEAYARRHVPDLGERLRTAVEARLGRGGAERVLAEARDYLALEGRDEGAVLTELLLLALANENPAAAPFRELFDDRLLAERVPYRSLLQGLEAAFEALPPFEPEGLPLPQALRQPVRASPHDLAGQLRYVLERWGDWVAPLARALLGGLDRLQEARTPRPGGPGPAALPRYADLGEEVRYARDADWMASLVLMAKQTHVWLHQLSRRFGRPIARLDQIPDEALAELARWGITGLWLVGIWERSPASRRIKELTGAPEAAASAYALFDYVVAADLGGEEALEVLQRRAARHGIRLGADMVPNHMGIDSRWTIEHPDWFLAIDRPPFPSYTFTGPNLSWHPDVEIYLEDGYYDRSDAAVVFKYVDRRRGRTLYIYHGNDGTSTPWNDTAQLNYLKEEVREAVLGTILRLARRFPILRFDAAMTLTRFHYRRLWFPPPGQGGAIPSRSRFALTQEEFDRRMPREFWREVIDRAEAEGVDVLFLAEAFWLLEGYFVRTLGMHRVYNSAFMHMLRDEENAKYRRLLKETLAFDPEILKRYVNFMTTPDEAPAAEQFGTGDKYFGICTLMATLPGLPLFGHGQFEGLREKYGMEYLRPRREEAPDPDLIARHEGRIVPLLRRRRLFAGVENFELYDVVDAEGRVLEDVLAFSNRLGDERALVVYNNRLDGSAGWIRTSVPKRRSPDAEPTAVSLAEGLALPDDPEACVAFRDLTTGLTYLHPCAELHRRGLYVALRGYQVHVFLDWRLLRGAGWVELARWLAGRGVEDVEAARAERAFAPVREALEALLGAEAVAAWVRGGGPLDPDVAGRLDPFLRALAAHLGAQVDGEPAVPIRALADLPPEAVPTPALRLGLLLWVGLSPLGAGPEGIRSLLEGALGQGIVEGARRLGIGEDGARALVRALAAFQAGAPHLGDRRPAADLVEAWSRDPDLRALLGVHEAGGTVWVRKEGVEAAVAWARALACLETGRDPALRARRLLEAARAAGYRLDGWIAALREAPPSADGAPPPSGPTGRPQIR